jgi:PHP domain
MEEIIANLHMHTTYSDGSGNHSEIAEAAIKAGLDVVIVTDHNVYVSGPEDYYTRNNKKVLMLVGEEIHDQTRLPQKSHLLVLGARIELSPLAGDLNRLLEAIRKNGGLAFVAHPTDPAAPAVNEDDLSWEDWQVKGLAGIEIWNAMSEFKSLLKTKLHALYYAYFPSLIARGPFPETLKNWDKQLMDRQRLMAIGGSDAHALHARLGPLRRTLFPYEFHFRAINTHILIDHPLEGNLDRDRRVVLDALALGRTFVANDMLKPARGFRFIAHGLNRIALPGDEITAEKGVTFQIRLPAQAACRLIRNGLVVESWEKQDLCTFITTDPGFYRVEVYQNYRGLRRGWIFSNPIFIRN